MIPILLIITGFVFLILALIIWINSKDNFKNVDETGINFSELLDYINYFSQKIDKLEQILLSLKKEFKELNKNNFKVDNQNIKKVSNNALEKNFKNNIINEENCEIKTDIYKNSYIINQVKKLYLKGHKSIEIAKQLNRSVREIDMILKLINDEY